MKLVLDFPDDARVEVSDGFHTFEELYEHRILLWLAFCKLRGCAWRSRLHSDGSSIEGWFLLGMGGEPGRQVTYHLPDSAWELASFAETFQRAPTFDGHTSADVLDRLKRFVTDGSW